MSRLRQEIEGVDRSIVLLLAARLDAAQRAIRIRTAGGRPVTDREQEHRVLRRSRAWARDFGVPPDLVDRLFRALIDEGKARYRHEERAPDSPVVTVLLAGPEGTGGELRSAPDAELVSVTAAR